MKSKLKPSLVVAFGFTALVVSALGQDSPRPQLAPAVVSGQPGSTIYSTSPDTLVGPGGSANSGTAYFRPAISTYVPYSGQHGWGVSQEEANLSNEAGQIARQLGEAKSDSDKEKLKTKLSDLLEKQFDQRQKRHEAEIEALEAQVKKLKDLVQKRQENRREIVSKRLDQIQREAQGLGW